MAKRIKGSQARVWPKLACSYQTIKKGRRAKALPENKAPRQLILIDLKNKYIKNPAKNG